MIRRVFLSFLFALALPRKKRQNLDRLIFEYERLFNSGEFIGNQVLYNRELWDSVSEAFTRIVQECTDDGLLTDR
jgi:hypothetical protein